MRVMASRSVAGSSDVLVAEEYGKPQERLQFVSAWSLGFHRDAMHQFGSRAIEDNFRRKGAKRQATILTGRVSEVFTKTLVKRDNSIPHSRFGL